MYIIYVHLYIYIHYICTLYMYIIYVHYICTLYIYIYICIHYICTLHMYIIYIYVYTLYMYIIYVHYICTVSQCLMFTDLCPREMSIPMIVLVVFDGEFQYLTCCV